MAVFYVFLYVNMFLNNGFFLTLFNLLFFVHLLLVEFISFYDFFFQSKKKENMFAYELFLFKFIFFGRLKKIKKNKKTELGK